MIMKFRKNLQLSKSQKKYFNYSVLKAKLLSDIAGGHENSLNF